MGYRIMSELPGTVRKIEGLSRRQVLKAGAAGTVLVSLAGLVAPAFAAGKNIKIGMFANFFSFDPPLATSAMAIAVNYHVIEGILDMNPETRELRAGVCDFPTEVGPTTYRVTIRPGARFHNGANVTADDVVFSIERTLDTTDLGSFYGQFLPYLDTATALDERTVELTLKYTTGALNEGLSLVKVVPRAAVEEMGREAFGTKPIGSGPYVFVSAVNNDSVVIEKFTDYNGPRLAEADRVEFLIQSQASARVAAFRAGETAAIADVPDRDHETIRADGLNVDSVPGFLMCFLMFNCSNEKFKDKRVRQALHYAIDKDAIRQIAYLGNAQNADNYLPRHHPYYITPAQQYIYDPAKAKSLLAEAGYGTGMQFKLNVWTDSTWCADAGNIVQQNWADIGVTTNQVTGGESLYESVFDGSYEAHIAIADQSLFGWDPNTLLGWHFGPSWNRDLSHWQTPEQQEIERLLLEALASTGRKQFDLYAKVQELAAVEVPVYPLHHRTSATGWSGAVFKSFHSAQTTMVDVRDAELT